MSRLKLSGSSAAAEELAKATRRAAGRIMRSIHTPRTMGIQALPWQNPAWGWNQRAAGNLMPSKAEPPTPISCEAKSHTFASLRMPCQRFGNNSTTRYRLLPRANRAFVSSILKKLSVGSSKSKNEPETRGSTMIRTTCVSLGSGSEMTIESSVPPAYLLAPGIHPSLTWRPVAFAGGNRS